MSFSLKSVKATHLLGYVALFCASFVFFVYLTFPYGVLKEAIGAQVAAMTGYRVEMSTLGPRFLVGLNATDLHIEAPSGKVSVGFADAGVRLNLLPLLIGRLSVDIDLETKSGGTASLESRFGLFKLLGKGPVLPRSVSFSSESFPIDDIVHFVLVDQATNPQTNPMLAPMLAKIAIGGKLNADAQFRLDPDEPTQSSGGADIRLADAVLKFNDPGLKVPDQRFSKALVKAQLENGTLVLDRSSGLTSSELDLTLGGKVNLKPVVASSQLDMNVALKLEKALKENYGFLMDALAGGSRNGELKMHVHGPLGSPAISTL